MNFGLYAVIDNATHHFEKMPEWTWTFKPTSSADELALEKFIRAQDRAWLEIAWRELALAFGGTTIPTSETDPTPILHPDARMEEVEAKLKLMPLPMVVELWKALGKANPLWGPQLAPEGEPSQDESEASETSLES
ncbi:MAG TPA: hypothetical protein PKD55_02385 [Bellilinea sp.]|nr:hypothetical protein [Bellilinea sp.]